MGLLLRPHEVFCTNTVVAVTGQEQGVLLHSAGEIALSIALYHKKVNCSIFSLPC